MFFVELSKRGKTKFVIILTLIIIKTEPAVSASLRHIMLIDDDIFINTVTKRVINRIAPELVLTIFLDAQTALEHLINSGQIPDMIFLDINMPEMDGWAFLEAFNQKGFMSTIYMLTSSIDRKEMNRALSYPNVKEFISKPLSQDKFREILGR